MEMHISVGHENKIGYALRKTSSDKAKNLLVALLNRDFFLKLYKGLNGITPETVTGLSGFF